LGAGERERPQERGWGLPKVGWVRVRDESRMSRKDCYRIIDFVSFVPIDFESDVKNENGTKTVNENGRVVFPTV
jgi:hypothetical protein